MNDVQPFATPNGRRPSSRRRGPVAHCARVAWLGAHQSKLAKSVDTARSRTNDAESLCEGGNLRKTKKRLQQAGKALTHYAHRLAGQAARKKLDATLRTEFLQAGQAIASAVKQLRSGAQCPPS
jgi:hypothetical protein